MAHLRPVLAGAGTLHPLAQGSQYDCVGGGLGTGTPWDQGSDLPSPSFGVLPTKWASGLDLGART